MSLSCTKPRGGAVSKTRAMPVDMAENSPSAPHSRKSTLKIVIPPRDSITASITPPIVSPSSGDPAWTCSTTKRRASPSPRMRDADHHRQHEELEEGEQAEVGHAAGVLQRLVRHEAADRRGG